MTTYKIPNDDDGEDNIGLKRRFRDYLEKDGVLEYLTNVMTEMIPDDGGSFPENGLKYFQNLMGVRDKTEENLIASDSVYEGIHETPNEEPNVDVCPLQEQVNDLMKQIEMKDQELKKKDSIIGFFKETLKKRDAEIDLLKEQSKIYRQNRTGFTNDRNNDKKRNDRTGNYTNYPNGQTKHY